MRNLGPDDPTEVGGYTIEGRLGEGGMGRVYLGLSPGGKKVAVKVARPELAHDSGFRARFRSEVEAARRVGGFHTAQVVDADPEADPPWMVTAFVPGRPLDRVVAQDGPMGQGSLRALGAALAEALQAIHKCDLVHRDLKPSNIIMGEEGPRLLDFGIAHAVGATRLTSTNQVVGTPGFLAPEQIQGGRVGPACDVFALGAVLVHAAGGQAFGQGSPMELMYRVAHGAPDLPDLSALPHELRPIVARCLERDPACRISPRELLTALKPGSAAAQAHAQHSGLKPLPGPTTAASPTHLPTEPDNAAAAVPRRHPGPWPPGHPSAGSWSAVTQPISVGELACGGLLLLPILGLSIAVLVSLWIDNTVRGLWDVLAFLSSILASIVFIVFLLTLFQSFRDRWGRRRI